MWFNDNVLDDALGYRTGKRGRRILGRYGQPEGLVEILGQTELRLPGPRETGDVLRIDGRRDDFVAGGDAFGIHRHQGPVLAGHQVGADIVPIDLAVEIADTRIVRIAFIRIRSLRSALKIKFAVKPQVRVGIHIALH
jgi:hypothetical protein